MGEVIIADILTRLDIPVERVLNEAKTHKLTDIVIIGYDEDGEEYFASSIADGGFVLWLLEKAKLNLLRIEDKLEGEL